MNLCKICSSIIIIPDIIFIKLFYNYVNTNIVYLLIYKYIHIYISCWMLILFKQLVVMYFIYRQFVRICKQVYLVGL